MNNLFYNYWSAEIHDDMDQQKRIKSASGASCTPVSIDHKNSTGVFEGSSGIYNTSCSKCNCIDFNRRKLPCKHMYRLSMELGMYEHEFSSDVSKISRYIPKSTAATIRDTVELVESLSSDIQETIYNFMYQIIYKKCTPLCVPASDTVASIVDCGLFSFEPNKNALLSSLKKNDITRRLKEYDISYNKSLSKQQLADWCIESPNISLDMFPDYCCIVISQTYSRSMHKLYKYLSRKYGTDTVYSDELGSFVTVRKLDTTLPDDEITSLLIEYGYYSM